MGGGGGPHVKMELNEAVKKYLENPSCYNTEEVLYLKRIVCARMGFGDYFLKFAHMGKPHERFFRLKRDLQSIFWTGGNQGNKAKVRSYLAEERSDDSGPSAAEWRGRKKIDLRARATTLKCAGGTFVTVRCHLDHRSSKTH